MSEGSWARLAAAARCINERCIRPLGSDFLSIIITNRSISSSQSLINNKTDHQYSTGFATLAQTTPSLSPPPNSQTTPDTHPTVKMQFSAVIFSTFAALVAAGNDGAVDDGSYVTVVDWFTTL